VNGWHAELDQFDAPPTICYYQLASERMLCPKCNSTDFVHGRHCQQCGHEESSATTPEIGSGASSKRRVNKLSNNLSFDFVRHDSNLPLLSSDWKRELKQKVAEVQGKKGRPRNVDAPAEPKAIPSPLPVPPPRVPEIKRTAIDPQPIAGPGYDIHKNLRDFQASMQKGSAEKKENLQTAAAKRSAAQRELPRIAPTLRSSPATASARATEPRVRAGSEPESQNWVISKGILLTRTLSGLIDLLIVAGCSGVFLGLSMRFGNIDVLSQSFRPVVWGSIVFFHLFYSLYFLGLTHKTIGMMLTGLEVVDEQAGQLLFYQLFLRTIFFLFSWALAMLGLFWGLWDHRSRCMHDFLSRTLVVRC
jgi:uncharacterized RDD family membrane protein YckC